MSLTATRFSKKPRENMIEETKLKEKKKSSATRLQYMNAKKNNFLDALNAMHHPQWAKIKGKSASKEKEINHVALDHVLISLGTLFLNELISFICQKKLAIN